uniref:Uncharacterized protein n=1 Tax=Ascaris lumbricoides TaxID=6252 RepID=A0A9J2Q4G0_ASCLU
MATYYGFLSTEEMVQHPLYELFSTLTSIQNRYTEVRPFVLTICTIVAYQQYRLAALSVLYCKPACQVENSRRKVQVVSCSPCHFGVCPVTALCSCIRMAYLLFLCRYASLSEVKHSQLAVKPVKLAMRVFFWLNFIAGAICIAGIIAGLIMQFKNKNDKSNDTDAVTFYFTTRLTTLSYDEVITDYAAAANRIQAQYAITTLNYGSNSCEAHISALVDRGNNFTGLRILTSILKYTTRPRMVPTPLPESFGRNFQNHDFVVFSDPYLSGISSICGWRTVVRNELPRFHYALYDPLQPFMASRNASNEHSSRPPSFVYPVSFLRQLTFHSGKAATVALKSALNLLSEAAELLEQRSRAFALAKPPDSFPGSTEAAKPPKYSAKQPSSWSSEAAILFPWSRKGAKIVLAFCRSGEAARIISFLSSYVCRVRETRSESIREGETDVAPTLFSPHASLFVMSEFS